jgi:dynein heavy chain
MPKIFQAIDTLALKDLGPNERPSAIGMNSCVGKEYVAFDTELRLTGKVEGYLEQCIDKMID